MSPDFQIFYSLQTRIWKHHLGHTIYADKNRRLLEATQNSILILMLRAIKSTPTEALESELNVVPIDPILEEVQRMEAIKLLKKSFIH